VSLRLAGAQPPEVPEVSGVPEVPVLVVPVSVSLVVLVSPVLCGVAGGLAEAARLAGAVGGLAAEVFAAAAVVEAPAVEIERADALGLGDTLGGVAHAGGEGGFDGLVVGDADALAVAVAAADAGVGGAAGGLVAGAGHARAGARAGGGAEGAVVARAGAGGQREQDEQTATHAGDHITQGSNTQRIMKGLRVRGIVVSCPDFGSTIHACAASSAKGVRVQWKPSSCSSPGAGGEALDLLAIREPPVREAPEGQVAAVGLARGLQERWAGMRGVAAEGVERRLEQGRRRRAAAAAWPWGWRRGRQACSGWDRGAGARPGRRTCWRGRGRHRRWPGTGAASGSASRRRS
jgi:hypothetical protein